MAICGVHCFCPSVPRAIILGIDSVHHIQIAWALSLQRHITCQPLHKSGKMYESIPPSMPRLVKDHKCLFHALSCIYYGYIRYLNAQHSSMEVPFSLTLCVSFIDTCTDKIYHLVFFLCMYQNGIPLQFVKNMTGFNYKKP